MSDADVDIAPDDGDIAAAEYVIGLLTEDEARIVETRAIKEPAIARSILLWQERLSELARQLKPVAPPPEIWQRLQAAIMPLELTAADLAPVPQPRRQRGRRLQGKAAPWVGRLSWAVGGAAVAVGVGAAVLAPKMFTSSPAVAALVPPDSVEPAYQVMLTKDGYATVVAVNPDFPANGALQLWTLDGATPVSLGLLPPKGRFRLERQIMPGAKLLISREPKGGSPDAGPSGPVVYQGNLIKG